MNSPLGPPPPTREETFRCLYDSAYVDLLRFVQRRVHPAHADDVVAEVFLVAWRRLDDVPGVGGDSGAGGEGIEIGAARAWLFGVARLLLLSTRREHTRQHALAVRVAGAGVPEADEAGAAADRIELGGAWRKLSVSDQETIALSVWDGLSAPEAAVVLHISPVAFRLRLSRARRRLRRHLDHGAALAAPDSRSTPLPRRTTS